MLRQLRQRLLNSRTPERFFALVLGFFVLYALTAQRGIGWGDSAEFQDWVLNWTDWICGPHFSNAHPLYVWLCRRVASTPFQVTLVSSFFGALAVGGFYLCSRRFSLALVFGLSHMLWWNSCLAEVQTMSLAFTAFETALFLRFLRTNGVGTFAALALLGGVHLEVHNFALLSAPVFAAAFFVRFRGRRLLWAIPFAALGALGASGWLYAAATRGLSDVLFGAYGEKVAGFCPTNLTLTAFNFALAGLSLFTPVVIGWWTRKDATADSASRETGWMLALLTVNALFWVRYFVPDQATFMLPTLFFAFQLVSRASLRRDRVLALMAMQLVLPLFFYQVLIQLPVPDWKTRHEGRKDAAYFALPWKIGEAK